MEEIAEAQIRLMLWLQEHHTAVLDRFFETFTAFGGQGYLLLVPLVLWCVDYRTGLRITGLMAVTLFANTSLKNWVQEPRPFQADARIESAGEEGFSFPSGHAMLVVAYWGVLAAWVEKRAFWWLAGAIMVVMAASRVYVGVHYPVDVTVGLALGALLLWPALRQRAALEAWLATHALGRQVALALAAGGVLLLFDALLVPDPLGEHLNAGAAGFLAGAAAGAALGLRHLSFTGQGVWWKRALRLVVGMLLTLIVLSGLRRVGVPDGALGNALVALELMAFGLWITFAVPWVFERIRLSD